MGYLLFADALGVGTLLARDFGRGDAALASLETEAAAALRQVAPGHADSVGSGTGAHLEVFNDSLFFHTNDLSDAIHYAAVMALRLLQVPRRRGGPILIRGAIARVEKVPRAVRRTESSPCTITTTRLITDNLTAAMVAEKRGILGGRIIIDRALIDPQWKQWHHRIQAKIIAVGTMADGVRPDVLDGSRDVRSHVDVAWMNAEAEGTFASLREPLEEIFFGASYSQRPALHAAASISMYRLTQLRRGGLIVMLRKHWAAAKRRSPTLGNAGRASYAEWLASIPKIEEVLGKKLFLPYDMSGLAVLPDG